MGSNYTIKGGGMMNIEEMRGELERLGYRYDVLRCGWHYGNNVTFIRPFGITDKELVELATIPLEE